MPTSVGSVLVLGAYPRHKGSPDTERIAFWERRVQEYRQLVRRQRFKDGRLVVLGDLNVHFSELGEKNGRYAKTHPRAPYGQERLGRSYQKL